MILKAYFIFLKAWSVYLPDVKYTLVILQQIKQFQRNYETFKDNYTAKKKKPHH